MEDRVHKEKTGHDLTRHGSQCDDFSTPSTQAQQVEVAKEHYAAVYSAYLSGSTTEKDVQSAFGALSKITGADLPAPSPNRIVAGTSGMTDGAFSPYTVFQQINSNYCGPATVETTLYYLASHHSSYWTSATYDTVTGAYDQLWGNSFHDQPILANSFWLATDYYSGTNWGSAYVPFTLNGWMGTTFYYGRTSSSIGNSSTYLSMIQSDVGLGYPIDENVLYDGNSFYPTGFSTGTSYTHWDTIYGWYWSAAQSQYRLNQGQVYGSPWTPYQDWPLSTVWGAVSQWNGAVW